MILATETLAGPKKRSVLSPTQQGLLDYMRKWAPKRLVRCPGGYWRAEGEDRGEWFGTQTVHALAFKRVIEYVEHRRGQYGEFPIAAVLKEGA